MMTRLVNAFDPSPGAFLPWGNGSISWIVIVGGFSWRTVEVGQPSGKVEFLRCSLWRAIDLFDELYGLDPWRAALVGSSPK